MSWWLFIPWDVRISIMWICSFNVTFIAHPNIWAVFIQLLSDNTTSPLDSDCWDNTVFQPFRHPDKLTTPQKATGGFIVYQRLHVKQPHDTHLWPAAPSWTVSPVCLCLYPFLTSSLKKKGRKANLWRRRKRRRRRRGTQKKLSCQLAPETS